MRIYLPLPADDPGALTRVGRAGRPELELPAGCEAWAVTPGARADRPGEDDEDLEYEALQDAVFAADRAGEDPDARLLVLAGDVPESAIREAADALGAFGLVLPDGARLRLASIHVSEQPRAAVRADDTDPALLWFDASETAEALAYADAGRSCA